MDKLKLLRTRMNTVLDDILVVPEMFGGLEAVEFQFLHALEILAFLDADELADPFEADRIIKSEYSKLLREEFGTDVSPIFVHLEGEEDSSEKLIGYLKELRDRLQDG